MRKKLFFITLSITLISAACSNNNELRSDTIERKPTSQSSTEPTSEYLSINSPNAPWTQTTYATYILTEQDLGNPIRYESIELPQETPPNENAQSNENLDLCGIDERLGGFKGITAVIQLSDGSQITQEIREATPEKIDTFLDITEKLITCTTNEEFFNGEQSDTGTIEIEGADRAIHFKTVSEGNITTQAVLARYENTLIAISQASVEETPTKEKIAELIAKTAAKK